MSDLVGEAYVRIHADTKFMKRAIRRDMEKIGKEGADSLLENFDQTLRDSADRKLRGAQRELADSIVGGDFDRMFKRHGGTIEEFVDDVGKDLDRMAKNGKIRFDDLETAAESMDRWAEKSKVARTAKEQADAFEASWREAEKLNRQMKEQERLGQQLADQYDRADLVEHRRRIKAAADALKAYDDEVDRAHAAALRMNADLDREDKARARLEEQINKAHAAAIRMDRERDEAQQRLIQNMGRLQEQAIRMNREFDRQRRSQNWASRLSRDLQRTERDMSRLGTGNLIGRMFGKGSRNDFLNFIGSAVGGIVQLGESIIKLPVQVLQKTFETIGNGVAKFRELREAGVGVAAILGRGMAAGAAVAVPALAALAASALVLSHVLPAVVSLVSALAGGLVAVAAAASFALAGWLLPMIPAAVALAAGVGALIPMFLGLKKAMNPKDPKKMSDSVKELKQTMSLLGDVTKRNKKEFLDTFAETLAPLLKRTIVPIMDTVQRKAIDLTKQFGTLFNGKQMAPFLKVWEQRLPIIFENLGTGINNMLAGFIKFFTPIIPYAQQLSKNFADMFETFNKWAGSAKGQTSIKSFMNEAWQAGEDLWQTIKNIGVAIANTFGIGQKDAGSGFLAWLDDLTGR